MVAVRSAAVDADRRGPRPGLDPPAPAPQNALGMDRVHVRRLASRWASAGPLDGLGAAPDLVGGAIDGPLAGDTQRMDLAGLEDDAVTVDDYVCQLWAQEIDVEPLGLLGQLEVALDDRLRATLYAVSCGHVVEVRAGDTVLSEIVAAVAREPSTTPVADLPASCGGAARSYQIGGLRVRTSTRLADLSPGRARWLAGLANDPSLRGRLLSLASGDPRLVLWAPEGAASVHSAHIFARAGRMILTETHFAPC